jgi:hypothetical protein
VRRVNTVTATDWNEWVAIGTLALAAATFLAVVVGVATVRASQRMADAAQATATADKLALEGSIRPLLIPTTPYPEPDQQGAPNERVTFGTSGYNVALGSVSVRANPGSTLISVPVRNVGAGIAVLSEPAPRVRPHGQGWQGVGGSTDRIIPAGETTRLQWEVRDEMTSTRFDAEVSYTDARGGQPMRTRLAVAKDTSTTDRWSVVGVELYEEAGDTLNLLVRSGDWPAGT